jgi:hypothetical protein
MITRWSYSLFWDPNANEMLLFRVYQIDLIPLSNGYQVADTPANTSLRLRGVRFGNTWETRDEAVAAARASVASRVRRLEAALTHARAQAALFARCVSDLPAPELFVELTVP